MNPFRPKALLLDFGGVIAESDGTPRQPSGLLERVVALAGDLVSQERIEADIETARRAYSRWRDAISRTYAPLELSHAELWGDWVATDWPVPARDAVVAEATELTYLWFDRGEGWQLRAGVPELFDLADAEGIPMAVVSNTACGAAFRDYLIRAGVSDRFAIQLYSDEVGVRKPNPAIALRATEALGVRPADVWFVGDTLHRDTLCAKRAGVGLSVLVRGDRDKPVQDGPWLAPDVSVSSMEGVLELLTRAVA